MTPGAEGHPNRHLLLTGGGARQLEIREIGAHNEHHHAHRAHEHEDRGTETPIHVPIQRIETRVNVVPLRVPAVEFGGENGSLCLRGFDSHARLEAADNRERISATVGFLCKREGQVQINVGAGHEDGSEVKGRGQDPGYGNGRFFMTSLRPTMAGSDAKRRFQRP